MSANFDLEDRDFVDLGIACSINKIFLSQSRRLYRFRFRSEQHYDLLRGGQAIKTSQRRLLDIEGEERPKQVLRLQQHFRGPQNQDDWGVKVRFFVENMFIVLKYLTKISHGTLSLSSRNLC